MSTNCQIQKCSWKGEKNQLLEHCQINHRRFVKEINNGRHFNFTFKDFLTKCFLLVGIDGLYWLLVDTKDLEKEFEEV